MQSKIKETLTINMIIVVMLCIIGGYSFRNGVSIETFLMEKEPVYKIETKEKTVSFMINVYEGNDCVEEMLKIFDKEDIKATFFIGGCWAAKNGDMVKKIYDMGHEIGNHGYNHKLHTKLSREQSKSEIIRTNSLIRDIIGKTPALFAPPSGDVNENITEDAKSLNMKTVMWTIDTIDWRDADCRKIYNRIERNLQPGALILMHPKEVTVKTLPDIILLLKAQGYQFKTVSEQLK